MLVGSTNGDSLKMPGKLWHLSYHVMLSGIGIAVWVRLGTVR